MEITNLYTAEAHESGAEVRIVNPETGENTDCYITIVGVDSKTFRSAKRKWQRKALDAIRDNKAIPDDDFGLLIDAAVDWRGFESEGKELAFSKKSLKALFNGAPLIADQVDKFIHDRANFTEG